MERTNKTYLRNLAKKAGRAVKKTWTVSRRPAGYTLEQTQGEASLKIVRDTMTAKEAEAFLLGVIFGAARA